MSSNSNSISKSAALLRLETFVLLVISFYGYYWLHGNWWYFALGLLIVDISMVGYLFNNKIGAITYNLGHSFVLPSLLLLTGMTNLIRWPLLVAIIWIAHISLDRALGFGLKQKDFRHTHLGLIGRK